MVFNVNMLFQHQTMYFLILSLFLAIFPVHSLFTVRMAGGSTFYEGRVEIFHQGKWGTICDDQWDNWDATVVCRMMGYSGGTVGTSGSYGPGSGNIWFKNVNCLGNETSIDQCMKSYWTEDDCDHSRDAGLVCNMVWRLGKQANGWKKIGCYHDSFIVTDDPKLCPGSMQICNKPYFENTSVFCLKSEFQKSNCIGLTRDTLIDQTGCYIGKEQNKFELSFPLGSRKKLHMFLLENSIEYTDTKFRTQRGQPFLNLRTNTEVPITVDGNSWILVKFSDLTWEDYAEFFSIIPVSIEIKGETKSSTTIGRTESTLSVEKRCLDGTIGVRCPQKCNCKKQKYCDQLIQFCGIDGCKAGYKGLDCQESCSVSTFGDGCLHTCHCKNIKDCDNINGTCWPGGCVAYYVGYNCQEFNSIIIITCSVVLIILVVVIPAVCFIYWKFNKSKDPNKNASRRVPDIPHQRKVFTVQANNLRNLNELTSNASIAGSQYTDCYLHPKPHISEEIPLAENNDTGYYVLPTAHIFEEIPLAENNDTDCYLHPKPHISEEISLTENKNTDHYLLTTPNIYEEIL